MAAKIELREVTRENYQAVIRLKLAEGQEDYVAPNVRSLVEAAYEPYDYRPRAIYDEAGEVVGFIMYGYWEERQSWWISRVMVDERHQGKGYGRAAIEQVSAILRDEHGADAVYLAYVPGNEGAEGLYRSLGFEATGEIEDDEVVMRRPLSL